MEDEINLLVKKYLNKNKNIDSIHEIFLKIFNKYEKNPPKKKTKKNRVKICRPVLLISDSSCDDFENINLT
tara:strand:- start:2 stop:214 length:213 start_codon:yes stop_codon:yes gene_type:complete